MALGGGAPLNIRVDTWSPEDLYDRRDVTRSEAAGREGQLRWSWSTMAHLMVCPRRFQLAVLHRMVSSAVSPALQIGIAVHTGMETFWRRIMWEDVAEGGNPVWRTDTARLGRVAAAAVEDALKVVDEDLRVAPGERMIAHKVVNNFGFATASTHARKWRPLWIEGVLDVDLAGMFDKADPESDADTRLLRQTWPREVYGPPPWPDVVRKALPLIAWEVRPDLVVDELEVDGASRPGIWVVDHKTIKQVRAQEFVGYRMDGQVVGNTLGCRLSRFPAVQGFVVDLLGKSDEPAFLHGYVEPSRRLQREFALEVGRRQAEYRRHYAAGEWPRVFTRAGCADQYGLCNYFAPCEEGAGAIPVTSGTYPGFIRAGEDAQEQEAQEDRETFIDTLFREAEREARARR